MLWDDRNEKYIPYKLFSEWPDVDDATFKELSSTHGLTNLGPTKQITAPDIGVPMARMQRLIGSIMLVGLLPWVTRMFPSFDIIPSLVPSLSRSVSRPFLCLFSFLGRSFCSELVGCSFPWLISRSFLLLTAFSVVLSVLGWLLLLLSAPSLFSVYLRPFPFCSSLVPSLPGSFPIRSHTRSFLRLLLVRSIVVFLVPPLCHSVSVEL